MESIKSLINNISNGNDSGAIDDFKLSMNNKIADSFNKQIVDVASSMAVSEPNIQAPESVEKE
jgi:hypothetical protein